MSTPYRRTAYNESTYKYQNRLEIPMFVCAPDKRLVARHVDTDSVVFAETCPYVTREGPHPLLLVTYLAGADGDKKLAYAVLPDVHACVAFHRAGPRQQDIQSITSLMHDPGSDSWSSTAIRQVVLADSRPGFLMQTMEGSFLEIWTHQKVLEPVPNIIAVTLERAAT